MKNLPLQMVPYRQTEYHGFCYTVKYNDNNETLIYSSINLQCWEEITEEQYLEIKNKGEKLKQTPPKPQKVEKSFLEFILNLFN